MKVTKKVTHDKMWIRIANGKDYVRLFVNRNGWRITGQGKSMRDVANRIAAIFKECMASGMKYGEAIDYIELEFV